MWYTALDTDEEAAFTFSYDPAPPVFEGSLPTETERFPVASETQTLRWKEQIVIGDWVQVMIIHFTQVKLKIKEVAIIK